MAEKVVSYLEKPKLEVLGYIISLVGRLSQPRLDARGAICTLDFQAQEPHLTNCYSVSQTCVYRMLKKFHTLRLIKPVVCIESSTCKSRHKL
jgi:hypothetical protein